MSDNTKWQKLRRARNRVLESIIEKDSLWLIEQAYKELVDVLSETDKSHVTLDELIRDANNYIISVQGGRTVVVSKNSPYAKKFIADAEKAEDEIENIKFMRRMNDFRRNKGL